MSHELSNWETVIEWDDLAGIHYGDELPVYIARYEPDSAALRELLAIKAPSRDCGCISNLHPTTLCNEVREAHFVWRISCPQSSIIGRHDIISVFEKFCSNLKDDFHSTAVESKVSELTTHIFGLELLLAPLILLGELVVDLVEGLLVLQPQLLVDDVQVPHRVHLPLHVRYLLVLEGP